MESDQNPMPPIDLFPRASRFARAVAAIFRTPETPLHQSDHYVREHFHPVEMEPDVVYDIPDNIELATD